MDSEWKVKSDRQGAQRTVIAVEQLSHEDVRLTQTSFFLSFLENRLIKESG